MQLPFGLLSILPTLRLSSLAVLAQIRVVAKAQGTKVNFVLMILVKLLTLIFACYYLTLFHISINKASLIKVEGNQLLDATTVARLAISLSSAGVTQMHKIPGPEVMAIKAVAIIAMVIVMVMVMGRPMVGPIPWMPMINRGI